MDKLLCRTVALLIVFPLFGPNVAMPRSADPDTDPEPSGSGAPETLNGSPADNGHLSGQAEQAKYQQQEEQRQEDKKQDGDQHREETRIQEQEIAFLEWVKEFQEIGQQPHRAPLVKEYMRENNLTIHDVKTMYGIEPSNPDRKRSAAITIAGIWNKCIIPYTFSDTLPEANKLAAQDAMKIMEEETGFRFYPYNNNNAELGLGHENYLKFIQNSGCNSGLGNKMTKGQDISACATVRTAIHELGHAFGMGHEHAAAGNFPFLDVHYKESTYVFTHTRWNLAQMFQNSKSYDVGSTLHYAPWMVRRDYIGTFSTMDSDFMFMFDKRDNHYYVFKAIQEYNKCYDEFPSCSPLPECEWDGYPSVVDGKCQCRCPEGLDPASRCTTVKPKPTSPAWPKGKYSFLKTTVDPCPEGFATGTMYSNPAWDVWDSSTYHFDKFDADEYVHNVCTKTEEGTGDPWPAGRYCILRYDGTCPDGFEYGLADTFGEVPTQQDVGTVPDGSHGQLFEYVFCCRNDGDLKEPMSLPFKSSFILYLGGTTSGCQEVDGMYHIKEKYYMRSDIDKHTHRRVGSLPYLYQSTKWTEYIYYCAYVPKNSGTECSVTKTLDDNEKTYTFTTPNFPNNYPKSSMCTWYIRSPEGSRMQLDFTKFEVSHSTDTDCKSYVRVKSFRPGSPGFKFCGHNYQKSHWTYTNYLTVDLISDISPTQTGFSATVRVFSAENTCYKGDGRDRSYAGKVTYDKDFNNCLPWSQVTSCPFHQFDSRFVDNDLAGHNYCRNIGIAGQPWCYTDAEKCARQNCDACMTGSCFDLFDDCQVLMAEDSSYCSNNKYGEAMRGCKKSCGQCTKHTELATGATCGAPSVVKGVTPTPTSQSYSVGDIVTYKCPTGTDWRESVCTSEGKWTPLNFICGGQPDDTDQEKCVMTDEYGYWNDKPCTDKANVVCEYTPTGPISCEDQLSNCEAVIRSKPDVCSAFPDYAWANCRKSCAVDGCSSRATCNDDANIGDAGIRVEGGDIINMGQIVKYKCSEGYYYVSGDLTRGCLPSGSLTGSAPVCSNAVSEIELFDKPYKAISPRNSKFKGPWTYLTASGGMTFPQAGKVASWTFYSHLKGGQVSFQVFRPSMDPLKKMTLTFIGQNHMTSLPDLRIHTVQIPEAQQVAVQKGDIYGIWLKSTEISFDSCNDKDLHKNDFVGFIYPLDGVSPETAKVGKEYVFDTMGDDCRVIGVKATLEVGVSPLDDNV